MATYATGVAATWDGLTFGEVTELRVTHGGSLPLARGSTWTLDLGTIEISCFATANVSTANYGVRSLVTIAGGGFAYRATAVLEKLTFQGVVNDVTRYGVTLRVQA
jgi:hypothetical protein